MTQHDNSDKPTKGKMSEMIAAMGAGFLRVGKTLEQRQNRLNAACTAWNIACGSPEQRRRHLEVYAESYLRFHPATSQDDLVNIMNDMKALVERKLQMFPDDKRQIVEARVVMAGADFRIEIVSATLQ